MGAQEVSGVRLDHFYRDCRWATRFLPGFGHVPIPEPYEEWLRMIQAIPVSHAFSPPSNGSCELSPGRAPTLARSPFPVLPSGTHRRRGGHRIYYHPKGAIIAITNRRDPKFERQLTKKGILWRSKRVKDLPASRTTTVTEYQVTGAGFTPKSDTAESYYGNVYQTMRKMDAAARRGHQYANRHTKFAWREARDVYEKALYERVFDEVLPNLSPAAWPVYVQLTKHRRLTIKHWQRVYEHGMPPIDLIFSPLAWLPGYRFTKGENRVLAAYWVVGDIARFISKDNSAAEAVLRRIQGAARRRERFPLLVPPVGAQEDPAAQLRYFESWLFRRMNVRLHPQSCREGGGHRFLSRGYLEQPCPVHDAGALRHLNLRALAAVFDVATETSSS